MTAIALTDTALRAAKRALTKALPDAKSSHLTEALASACGFGSQAALLAAVKSQPLDDPDIVLLDDGAFVARLATLDPSLGDLAADPIWFDWLDYSDTPGLFRTFDANGEELPYVGDRASAWRNAMIAAINVGIGRRLFTVRSGDNRWPGVGEVGNYGVTYTFQVEGIPGIAHVADGGFDELMVHVALWPSAQADEWIDAANAGFLAGDLFASGWLERRDGAWLQYNGKPMLNCRRRRLAAVAALRLRPDGYAETGSLKV